MREREANQKVVGSGERLPDPDAPPVFSAGWRVPTGVGIEGRYVRASAYLASNAPLVFPDRTLLRRFVALAEGSDDEAIARFVKKWGLLGLCRHGLSPAHTRPSTTRRRPCTPRIHEGFAYERITRWKEIAGEAQAILSISASLDEGGSGIPADWKAIGFDNWRVGWPQTNLSEVVNGWLDAGAVVPRLTLLKPEPKPRPGTRRISLGPRRIILDGAGLAGGLALMLLLAVARSEAVIPCSEPDCPNLAEPARRGARPYCAEHLRRGVRARDRAKDFRVKNPAYYRNRRARLASSAPTNPDVRERGSGA